MGTKDLDIGAMREKRRGVARTGVALSTVLLTVSCTSEVSEPDIDREREVSPVASPDTSFERFLASAHPVQSGGFLTQGDIWAPDEDALFDIWTRYNERSLDSQEGHLVGEAPVETDAGTGLTSVTVGLRRADRLLSDKDLTFCIDSTTFSSSQVSAIRSAMQSAAVQWRPQTGVVFREVSTTPCSNQTTSVDFNVRAANSNDGTNFAARAWFPGYSRGDRELLIRLSAIGGTTFVGLMAHELGHMQGFIHEHAARDDAGCIEPSGSMVTRYDLNSIMHYPTCNGPMMTNTLSRYDQLGARCAYFGECEWIRNTHGLALDIAAANGQVWIIGTSRRPFRMRSDGTWQLLAGIRKRA